MEACNVPCRVKVNCRINTGACRWEHLSANEHMIFGDTPATEHYSPEFKAYMRKITEGDDEDVDWDQVERPRENKHL